LANLLITVRRKSVIRRFWRELGALVRWGLQDRVYGDSDAPFGVLGHESFSVGWRNRSDEVELVFFEDDHGLSNPQGLSAMRREMREAITAVARRHGYSGVYYRERKPTLFVS